jgi:hypothetical protein
MMGRKLARFAFVERLHGHYLLFNSEFVLDSQYGNSYTTSMQFLLPVGGRLRTGERQKIWTKAKRIWIRHNPLKSHNATKTFLGKAWQWNHTYLEMFSKKAWSDAKPGDGAANAAANFGLELIYSY